MLTAVVPRPTDRSRLRGARAGGAVFVLVALAYAAGAELSYGPFGAGSAPAFFPPAGVSLAALVLLERRHWPVVLAAVAVAEVAVDLRHDQPLSLALPFAVANMGEALVGASLYLNWSGRDRPALNTRTGIATFSLAALVIGPAVGAAVGTAAQLTVRPDVDVATTFGLWWTGDSLGVLVVGATILAWRRGAEPPTGTAAEWVAILTAVGVLSLVQFATGARPLAYLPMAALSWAGLRLGVRGVLTCGLLMAVISDLLTAQGYGPWPAVGGSPAVGLVYLKLFLAIAISSAWLLAVEVAGRRRAELQNESEKRVREAAAALEERFVRLRRLTAALSRATTRDAIARAWRDEAPAALGGVTQHLFLLRPDRLGLEAFAGVHPTLLVSPGSEAERALHGGSVIAPSARYDGHGAVLVPLTGRQGPIGLLRVTWAPGKVRDAAELETITAVADRVSDALERVHLLDRTVEAGERLAALQRLTSQLGAARTIEEVAQVTIDRMPSAVGARTAGLLVSERAGRVLRTVHQSATPPPWLVPPGEVVALRGGPGGIVTEVARSGLARYLGNYRGVGHEIDPVPDGGGQWAVLPIRSAGRLRGVLWLFFGDEGPTAPADRRFLESVTAQCALMLARSVATASEHEAAVQLQQALLPQRFPAIVGLAAAARYLAAGEGLSVGGDWYDIVARRDGRAVAVIGDVVGHDVTAAAAMGQLRSALSVVAIEAEGPADAFARLDDFPGGHEIGFATACYLDYASATGKLRYAMAGHPAPLLLSPDGAVGYLEGGRSKPLFAVTGVVRVEASATIADGSRLVCFTDGLVERPEHSLAEGFAELRRVCIGEAALPLADFADAVLLEMTRGVTRTDDVAMLCLQLARSTP